MHIIYIDDSGDDRTRVFSALSIPTDGWSDIFSQILAFRRTLRDREGVFVKVEFHATEFVAGRGRISPDPIPKGARCRLYRETLTEITKLPGVRLFNCGRK